MLSLITTRGAHRSIQGLIPLWLSSLMQAQIAKATAYLPSQFVENFSVSEQIRFQRFFLKNSVAGKSRLKIFSLSGWGINWYIRSLRRQFTADGARERREGDPPY